MAGMQRLTLLIPLFVLSLFFTACGKPVEIPSKKINLKPKVIFLKEKVLHPDTRRIISSISVTTISLPFLLVQYAIAAAIDEKKLVELFI